MYDKKAITKLLEQISTDRGVPRNVKLSIEQSIAILGGKSSGEEKLSYIISLLDETSNDPNIPLHTRTNIWNIVSVLESMSKNSSH